MDKKQIEALLREIIAKQLPEVSPSAIQADSELAALGVDSLAFSWILADMEDRFEVEMQGGDILKLKTLSDAVEYVAQNMPR